MKNNNENNNKKTRAKNKNKISHSRQNQTVQNSLLAGIHGGYRRGGSKLQAE